MANNSGSNAKTSCNPNPNSSGEHFECPSSFSQLAISQTGSESKAEAGTSLTTGSALGQQGGSSSEPPQQPQKSPHVNQYWAYSQLPTPSSASSLNQAASSTNQPAAAASSFINTASSTGGTVFSRAQDNVSLVFESSSNLLRLKWLLA